MKVYGVHGYHLSPIIIVPSVYTHPAVSLTHTSARQVLARWELLLATARFLLHVTASSDLAELLEQLY